MMDKLQKIILMLTAKGEQRERAGIGRKAALLGARLLGGSTAAKKYTAFMDRVRFHEEEMATWVTVDQVREGMTGPFDACDLRHWLQLAEMAGVNAVPAREVLRLSQAEASRLSGGIDLFAGRAGKKLTRAMKRAANDARASTEMPVEDLQLLDASLGLSEKIGEPEELIERTFAAMDDVPEGWMVRNVRAGSSELKALAGVGAAGSKAPEVRFGPDLEVGPGWVRNGNRRRINVADQRTVKVLAEGPPDSAAFVARPWAVALRYFEGEDPHRHGTQFAGKGVWPAEWRAFVEDGKVVGVSFYYAWCGDATAENAEMALAVRAEAQKIVDVAEAVGMWPRLIDLEHARDAFKTYGGTEGIERQLETFGREKVSCTLDFIETENGLMLLEGGPAHTPFGGGHPCGFAGVGRGKLPARFVTDGVAFRSMPHIRLGDHPKEWFDGDHEGCILTWQETEELSLGHSRRP